jgi:hypothetical protein
MYAEIFLLLIAALGLGVVASAKRKVAASQKIETSPQLIGVVYTPRLGPFSYTSIEEMNRDRARIYKEGYENVLGNN